MRKGLKKTLFTVIYILVIVTLFEILPFLFSPLFLNTSYSRKNLKNELRKEWDIYDKTGRQGAKRQTQFKADRLIHPYLGFVHEPYNSYNSFGFPGPEPISSNLKDTIVVCLTGGSVAKLLYQISGDYLAGKLKEINAFNNKPVKLVSVALGGFKQPQQLLALNYLYTLGAGFDVVINLDGFNEIVLPYSDNLALNIHPSYPRHWDLLSRHSLNVEEQLHLAHQAEARQEKERLARFFVKSKLEYSNLGLFLWKVLDNKKVSEIIEADRKLKETLEMEIAQYQTTGPPLPFSDTLEYFDQLAEYWKNASLLMGKLARSNDFVYFHFLQPNQYVPGSKTLTREEQEIAYVKGPFLYKTAVQQGYSFLINNGKELTDENINYADLTMMFKNTPETVYNDECCHFNEHGYEIISDSIAEYISKHFHERKLSGEY